jgi:phytoene synthase
MLRPVNTPSPEELEAAYAHCRQVVAERAKNFSYAFLLLPGAKRQALEAIYGYCRVADDFADDEGLAEEERARRLADLRARLRGALPAEDDPQATEPLSANVELDALMIALGDTAGRFGVSRDHLDLVAQGCVQDLSVTRYETFEDLYDYCYLVASAVGLACLDVFGYRGDSAAARSLAVDLGIAMQLTNIIRDVKEDIERERIYLPLEDLRRFDVSEAQIRAGHVDRNWRAFLAFQVQRARCYFARGELLASRVESDARVCPLALASIYKSVLGEVERADYDVFTERVSLSSRRKLGLMGLAMGRGLLNV